MKAVNVELDEHLDLAIAEAFEGMAFADVERADGAEFEWQSEEIFWAQIATIDPAVGELTLVCPPAVAQEVAGAALGEQDLLAEQILDVLGELLNTIGGSWLGKLRRDGRPVELGLPKMGRGDWGAPQAGIELAVYASDEEAFGVALRRSAG